MTAQNKQAPSWADYIATITIARSIATERSKNVIDLPDLLMALALDAGKVGETLRSHGLQPKTLADATTAVDSKLLKELGITAPAPVSLPELAGYELADRAQRILGQAKTPGNLALALLQEPSGYIEEILTQANIEQSSLQVALEQLPESTRTQILDSSTQDRISASHTVFLPSSLEKTWEFVSNPSNLPSWLPAIESLDVEPGSTGPWFGRLASPPGKFSKARVRPSRQVQEVALTVNDAESKRLKYELKFPQEPRLNTQQISVHLTEDSNGCLCQITTAWIRARRKNLGIFQDIVRKPLGIIARPAVKYFVQLQATVVTAELRKALTRWQ